MKRRSTISERSDHEGLGVVLAVVAASLIVFISRNWLPPWVHSVYLVLMLAALAHRLFFFWRLRKRVRELAACDWRRCLYCFFDLRGLPDHGACPECGEPYDIREVRAEWKDVFAAEPEARTNDDM